MRSKNNNLKQCLSSIVIAVSILCSFGFLFLGCATAPYPKAESPLSLPPLPKAKNSAPPATAEIKITCREYLLKGKNEETGYGLYSYLLFSGEPTSEKEFKRYLRLYQAYRGKFKKYPEYREYYEISKENVNIAYWPLRVDSYSKIPPSEYDNEKDFIKNYDYVRANVILRNKLPGMTNPGPFIIAYHLPLSTMPKNPEKKEILIIDLSRIDEELFSEVLASFQGKVVDDPKTWKGKFDWELVRIHFYSAIRLHGEPILYAAEWVGEFFGVKKAFAEP